MLNDVDWEKVLPGRTIRSAEHLDGGNANDTWQLYTEAGKYVVKISRATPDHQRLFWNGLYTVFGLDVLKSIPYRKELAEFIDRHSQLKVPQIIRTDSSGQVIPKPYVVTEFLGGEPTDLEKHQDREAVVFRLGEHLGRLHEAKMDTWGCFPQKPHYPKEQWKSRLPALLRRLTEERDGDQEVILSRVEEASRQINELADPAYFSLILPDLKPSQFKQKDGRLYALVDIESHVVGPRELDWIALEYSLTERDVRPFTAGYEKHSAAPSLAEVRQPYRLLYYLINVLGWEDLNAWMNQPAIFD